MAQDRPMTDSEAARQRLFANVEADFPAISTALEKLNKNATLTYVRVLCVTSGGDCQPILTSVRTDAASLNPLDSTLPLHVGMMQAAAQLLWRIGTEHSHVTGHLSALIAYLGRFQEMPAADSAGGGLLSEQEINDTLERLYGEKDDDDADLQDV